MDELREKILRRTKDRAIASIEEVQFDYLENEGAGGLRQALVGSKEKLGG